MTAPEKWLDAAALDLLHDENAHGLLGNYPEVISQARAALALRDELAECRAKLAQAQTDIDGWRHGFKCDFCAESENKLAQAEQSVKSCDVCGNECSTWDGHALKERAEKAERDLASSQARERELREDLLRIEMGCSCGCDDFAAKALARPVDDAALREMLGECATDAVDRYIADGCTASEAASATVSRLLGGGK